MIEAMNSREPTGPISVLLFDGDCALCNGAVRFVLNHEKTQDLRFAKLTGQLGRRLRNLHPELQDVDSVIWADLDAAGEAVHLDIRSAAVIRVVRYLGGGWSLLQALRIVPRPLRDWVYDLVARNRRRIFQSRPCPVTSTGIEKRFLK